MVHKVTFFTTGLSKAPAEIIELRDFLTREKDAHKVLALRKGFGGKLGKLGLACIIPGGIFTGKTNKDFIKSSGILYIDLDAKDNGDMVEIKNYLVASGKFPWLYALQASSGGGGLSVFFRIAQVRSREAYRAYYKHMAQVLAGHGIVADRSCININRQRYASIDADTYINESAKILKINVTAPKVKALPIKIDSDLKEAILYAIKTIESEKYDMTEDYNTWLYVAGLFHKVFGEEQGRRLFHRISRFYPKYDKEETDRKYDYCRSFENASPHKFFQLLTPKLKL